MCITETLNHAKVFSTEPELLHHCSLYIGCFSLENKNDILRVGFVGEILYEKYFTNNLRRSKEPGVLHLRV